MLILCTKRLLFSTGSQELDQGNHLTFDPLRQNEALLTHDGHPILLSLRILSHRPPEKVSLFAQSLRGPIAAKAFK